MSEERAHRHKIRVRYAETDQMGVVYYANYLVWMEVGRTEMLRNLGLAYKSLEEAGISLPVKEAHVNYKASALYDDNVEIRSWISKLTRVSVKIDYTLYNDDNGVLLATGFTYHPFMTGDKIIKLPDNIYSFFEKGEDL